MQPSDSLILLRHTGLTNSGVSSIVISSNTIMLITLVTIHFTLNISQDEAWPGPLK